jgi:hypothetical protein
VVRGRERKEIGLPKRGLERRTKDGLHERKAGEKAQKTLLWRKGGHFGRSQQKLSSPSIPTCTHCSAFIPSSIVLPFCGFGDCCSRSRERGRSVDGNHRENSMYPKTSSRWYVDDFSFDEKIITYIMHVVSQNNDNLPRLISKSNFFKLFNTKFQNEGGADTTTKARTMATTINRFHVIILNDVHVNCCTFFQGLWMDFCFCHEIGVLHFCWFRSFHQGSFPQMVYVSCHNVFLYTVILVLIGMSYNILFVNCILLFCL